MLLPACTRAVQTASHRAISHRADTHLPSRWRCGRRSARLSASPTAGESVDSDLHDKFTSLQQRGSYSITTPWPVTNHTVCYLKCIHVDLQRLVMQQAESSQPYRYTTMSHCYYNPNIIIITSIITSFWLQGFIFTYCCGWHCKVIVDFKATFLKRKCENWNRPVLPTDEVVSWPYPTHEVVSRGYPTHKVVSRPYPTHKVVSRPYPTHEVVSSA